MPKLKLVRRPQTLTPFGVGAVMDIEGESLVGADITRWKHHGEELREPRLERVLGVQRFRMAPAAPEPFWMATERTPGVPYYRFPRWQFCSLCRQMVELRGGRETGEAPICLRCQPRKVRLTPMRFVMACPRGHLADVPWVRWAHSYVQNKCELPKLSFLTRPGGSGLEYVGVRCRSCGAYRNLLGIAQPNKLRELKARCPGRQPWQSEEEARPCDAVPQVLQRGATNLTFGITESSIDIPPFSNWETYNNETIQVTMTDEFRVVMNSEPGSMVEKLIIPIIASKVGLDEDVVKRVLERERRGDTKDGATDTSQATSASDLLPQEFEAFVGPDREAHEKDRFIKRHISLAAYSASEGAAGAYGDLARWLLERLGCVVEVTRLREVRVLKGFSRLSPVAGETDDGEGPGRFALYDSRREIPPSMVPADLGGLRVDQRWLPGVEVYGEGIFLSLSEDAVQHWENEPTPCERARKLEARRLVAAPYLPTVSPRLILLHTLAHCLIRQLSFECGYSLASLRERLYAAEPAGGSPMAGILIYTSAGDAEGTLGGLVREAQLDRMLPTLVKALQTAEWCSSDPLCRESGGQGIGGLNLAACHACALVPETSCVLSNRLLDRTLLLGSPAAPTTGFFSSLIEQVMATMGVDRIAG